jgi:hypothetical protein
MGHRVVEHPHLHDTIPAIKTLSPVTTKPKTSPPDNSRASPEPLEPPLFRDFHPSINIPKSTNYIHQPFITPSSHEYIPRTPFNTLESQHPASSHAPVATAFLPLTQEIRSSLKDATSSTADEELEDQDSDDEFLSQEESDRIKRRYWEILIRQMANTPYRSGKQPSCRCCEEDGEGDCCCEEHDGENCNDTEDIKVEKED